MKSKARELTRPVEILAVDDAPESVRILSRILNDEGYIVTSSSSGEEALAMISIKQPDLVLLDIKMPGIGGIETCNRIKANPVTADLPVIFISALGNMAEKTKGFEAGGADYITKPFQPKEVILRINHLIKTSFRFKELMTMTKRVENIIDGTDTGSWEWNLDTDEQVINSRWAEMLGYTKEEIPSSNAEVFTRLIHPDDLSMANQQIERLINKTIMRYDIEFRLKHKDGHWVWINSRAKITSWDSEDKPLFISGSHLDISKRKKMEAELYQSEERYGQLREQSRSFIWEVDNQGLYNFVDYVSEIVTGYTPDELIAKKYFFDLCPIGEREEFKNSALAAFSRKLPFENHENRIVTKDDKIIWVSTNGIPVLDDAGNLIGYRGSDTDITMRKEAENILAKSEMRLVEAQRLARLGNWELDTSSRAVWGSEEAFHIYGFEFASNYLPLNMVMESIHPEYLDFVRSKLENLIKNKEKYDIEYKISHKGTGAEIFIRSVAVPEVDKDGKVTRVIGIIQDITEQKKKEEKIKYLSNHDQLTGVYSRRYYENEIERIDTSRNLPITVIIGDVNGLKLVNDSFGHSRGDDLLKKAADVLKQSCRAEDVIARWGGDEFVIILPKTDGLEADQLISRIKHLAMEKKVESIELSISFGSGTKSESSESISDIIKRAEDELYRNKLYEGFGMRSATVELIMNTLYEKNNREMLHSKRVSALCEAIALQMDYSKDEVAKIRIAGMMHDIGKIGIEENILNKAEKLDDREWNQMKKHSEIGYRILSSVNEFLEIARFVLEHQEKWDGTGYPRGLKGEEISRQARIITLADAYDAMTTKRSYGKQMSIDEAKTEIRRCAGTHFDPEIAEVFLEKVLTKMTFA